MSWIPWNKLAKKELRVLKKLNTPEKMQKFIDTQIEYDPNREDRSVIEVLADRKAECYNGALLATTCLLYHGFKASIVELLARQDEEHILCVYTKNGKFGSIAQSKFLGLKSRNPIYSSVRELVVSYIEFFFSFDGRFTLMSYTNLFPMSNYKYGWLDNGKVVVQIGKELRNYKHNYLIKPNDPFYYVSKERYWKEILTLPKGTLIPKKYQPRPKNI